MLRKPGGFHGRAGPKFFRSLAANTAGRPRSLDPDRLRHHRSRPSWRADLLLLDLHHSLAFGVARVLLATQRPSSGIRNRSFWRPPWCGLRATIRVWKPLPADEVSSPPLSKRDGLISWPMTPPRLPSPTPMPVSTSSAAT